MSDDRKIKITFGLFIFLKILHKIWNDTDEQCTKFPPNQILFFIINDIFNVLKNHQICYK